jgi:phosphoserine phosphatase
VFCLNNRHAIVLAPDMTHDDSMPGIQPQASDESGSGAPEITASQLIELLDRERGVHATVLAFDADGTLWTGDVSDDVFLCACREGWLLEAVRPALRLLAESIGVGSAGSASQIALRLFEATQQGLFDECTLFAMMAWCYAGRTASELTDYAAKVLSREALARRMRPELEPILVWARRSHLPCVVVSASPQPIVAWAASHWGFAPEQVIGTMPLIQDGVISDHLIEPVPFGANKCTLLKRRFPDAKVLASFGDSHFDFELLQCAEFPVAVCPKPTLRSNLLRLSRVVVLRTQTLAL